MRRVSGWKVLGILGAAMALSVGGLYLWLRSAEARRWDEMGRLAEELIAEVPTRDASRPVLRGEPVAGDAWNLYRPLLETYAPDEPWRKAAVAALRVGVRRGSARNPYGPVVHDREKSPDQESFLEFGQAAILTAMGEAEEGRRRRAAELMLDAGLYARDVGHNGNFILQYLSFRLLDQVADELTKLLQAMGSDRETPAQIARELEILDRALGRSGYVSMNELALEARVLRNSERAWEWWGYPLGEPGWRYAFSRRLSAADGLERLVAWLRRHLDEDDVPPGPEGATREMALWIESVAEGNPLMEAVARKEDFWAGEGRPIHARLHLLRMAAHFLATGELLDLPDPYGDRLKSAVEGSRLRAWSVWKEDGQEIEVTR